MHCTRVQTLVHGHARIRVVCRSRAAKKTRRRAAAKTALGTALRTSRATVAPRAASGTTTSSSQALKTATTTTSGTLSTSKTSTPASSSSPFWAGWNILSNPIDPTQQTDLPFGDRSHWLQPWRAYLDTPPASTMRNAVGINFNVAPQYASLVAQFLAQEGFKRARLEIGWRAMSYADPSQLQDPATCDTLLGALKAAGIRPLILLNANDGDPGPSTSFTANITQPASAGATTVQVDSASAQQLVPGLSGFDVPGGTAAAFMATSVSPSGQVTLSQPLPVAIPAGAYKVTTLRYMPFTSPFTSTGSPDQFFENTLAGWLLYVKAVTSEARKVLGNDDFDVEVWNEMSFGSNFLDISKYYKPVPALLQGTGSVTDQLLARTVQWIREPANDLPDVGIGDGFANESPFVSGANVPLGLTAIDKHPYPPGFKQFPQDALQSVYVQSGIRPVNALGQPDGVDVVGTWLDSFTPTYDAFFPEYYLSGIQTEYMERGLSPITTTIGGTPYGRNVKPPGATTPLQDWVTEMNIDPADGGLTNVADMEHLQAKAALRTLSAYVNKGVSALYFYAVSNGDWSMVDPTQPGGGPTMTAIQRFMQAFAGPDTIATPRSLSLL